MDGDDPTRPGYSISVLRRRGWPESLIQSLLGQPDFTAENPHGGRFPMRMFARPRVIQAEKSDAFLAWVESRRALPKVRRTG
jgi:hypothetical protein